MKVIISINTTWNIFNFRVGLIKTLQLPKIFSVEVAEIIDQTEFFKN